jgi:putative component of membrane protein insertase Oxa1/YidC/SpoIIIJ protein YidD
MKRLSFLPLLLFSLLLVGFDMQTLPAFAARDSLDVHSDEGVVGPSGIKSQTVKKTGSQGATVFTALITFFQEVISPVDGDRCPSYPTCAAYSKQAYQKHGAVLGTLMTVDRLIHEASEHDFSPTIKVYGVNRIYDPVTANEFWLRHPQDHTDQPAQ